MAARKAGRPGKAPAKGAAKAPEKAPAKAPEKAPAKARVKGSAKVPASATAQAGGRAKPRVLDTILGAPSRVRLLRVFSQADAPMSGREAARHAKVAHRASVLALGALVKAGVLRVKRGTTRHEYQLETKHPLAKRLVRLFEREREG